MSRKSVAIVSFNDNEWLAVDSLLSDIASGAPSPWARDGESAITRSYGEDEWRLEHVALRAQGNVVAGAQLAEFFIDHEPPDYVVFYGCAGAMRPVDGGSVFLVRYANHLSLGTVTQLPGEPERVTLKNKWLCDLHPKSDVGPLPPVSFAMCMPGEAALDLLALSGIPGARVVATDKVVRILPGVAPAPVMAAPSARYAKAEWSYGEALALWAEQGDAVIVEMESYGIGRIAQALKIEDRVAVLRVTTDALVDHADSDDAQRLLLNRARRVLGRIIAILFDPTHFEK
jgi:nucleoside phosphorylase